MSNKLQLSGQIIKNGQYYILKTEDFDILIVCYSLQHLEKWLGDHVTITGRLRKVKTFHIYAEKIEMQMDALKRKQAEEQQEKARRAAEIARNEPQTQQKTAEIDLAQGFSDLVRKMRNQD